MSGTASAQRCLILSDSTCDLSAARAAERGVRVIPFHYTEGRPGGLQGADDLFQTTSSHEFYDAVRGGARLLTSQPSQLEYEEALAEAWDEGVPAVLFSISSGISGGYEGALAALARLREERGEEPWPPLYVVDSLVASTPLQLLVEGACDRRDAGWDAREIFSWARRARGRLQTLFMVDDLEALHRGGRIPKAAATLGNMLTVKPLLSFDAEGRLSLVGVARGRKKGMRQLADNFASLHAPGPEGLTCAIGDADCPKDARRLAELVRAACPEARILRSTIGPTIGVHVGAGMLSCCFWGA